MKSNFATLKYNQIWQPTGYYDASHSEYNICKILFCRNALSLQMMEDLISNITFNQDDPGLRCIVLYGEGKVFSAGHNLKELVGTCLWISIMIIHYAL